MWEIAVMIAGFLGYVIGRLTIRWTLKPKGRIIFQDYVDENDEPAMHCVFQLDLDLEDLAKEKQILLTITKEEKHK